MMVLIAVEDTDVAESYRSHLVESGFSAMTVSTANELLTVAHRLLPGFTVVDADSPLFGGLNIARRARMAGSDTVLIGLMRAPTAGLEKVARNAGFDAVLAKPCTHETLVTELLARGADDEEDEPLSAIG